MLKVSSLQGNLQSQRIVLLVALLVVIADQLTKLWVQHSLLWGESLPQEGFLRLTHVRNEGIVFGISVPQAVPIILPLLVVTMALFVSHRFALLDSRLFKASLGLFIGGSVGNFIDRVRHGYVTDFIDFDLWGNYHWPAFNLADLAVVVGVVLLVYSRIRPKISTKQG